MASDFDGFTNGDLQAEVDRLEVRLNSTDSIRERRETHARIMKLEAALDRRSDARSKAAEQARKPAEGRLAHVINPCDLCGSVWRCEACHNAPLGDNRYTGVLVRCCACSMFCDATQPTNPCDMKSERHGGWQPCGKTGLRQHKEGTWFCVDHIQWFTEEDFRE